MLIANKRAFHDYAIEERLEAGLVLNGQEVKALRIRGADLGQSSVRVSPKLEVYLVNAYIAPYQAGHHETLDPRRERKLLLHSSQIKRVYGKLAQGNFRLVPLKMYTRHNRIKLEVGLGKHKKKVEKKEVKKLQDIDRDTARQLRGLKE